MKKYRIYDVRDGLLGEDKIIEAKSPNSVLDRVSCWCCRNKNLKELKNIYNFLPNYWQKLRELQKKIDIPFRNKSTIFELENQLKNQSLTDKNYR